MNVDPMQLIQLMKSGLNPQQLLMSIIQQPGNSNSPLVQNAYNLAKKNDISGLEMIARNVANQRGLNYEESFAQFLNYFK